MKSYFVRGTFPMADDSIGNIDFMVEANTLKEAVNQADQVVANMTELDITLWAIEELADE